MENSIQIAERFREVLLNGKWIANTNYKEQLSNLTWKQAIIKIESLNTIASLAFHINYYIEGLLIVFEGGNLEIRDKYSFDAPIISSQAEWNTLVNNLLINSEKFAIHLEHLSNKKIEENFVNEKYGTYRRNIEGIIEHCYYHLGQITLIKKMIMESSDEKNKIEPKSGC